METAVQTGFRGIDTAGQPRHYDEQLVGVALKRLAEQGIEREAIFLQTKFTPLSGQDPQRVPYDPQAPIGLQVGQSFESSLRNLGTPYVDSLMLHSPVVPYRRMLIAWEAMEKIHDAGGARQLGISNCYSLDLMQQLYADVKTKPVLLQNRFCQDSRYDTLLRKWCDQNGVIYQSFWTLTANPHILDNPVVQRPAEKYGKTTAQIFFRFLNQIGIVPLTGTCSPTHMQEDLRIFEFTLNADETEKIAQLLN